MIKRVPVIAILFASLFLLPLSVAAQKSNWRQATPSELASVLPSRAPVIEEHIETEMRTASGIVDEHGHFIAGVVLITAGYSAEGKFSHYLVLQVPAVIGGIKLQPGEYVFGWTRTDASDALKVHFNLASTGAEVGTANALPIAGQVRVESLHIWPPAEKPMIQIGRFAIRYSLKP